MTTYLTQMTKINSFVDWF